MMNTQIKTSDQDLIAELGGPREVAALLNYGTTDADIQVVRNWIKRGIPNHVKVDHPQIFLKHLFAQNNE